MLKQQLEQLGLSDKEARVYLAALELGSATVQKISQKAKVNRATTYVIIDSLIEMGLMSSFEEGKKTHYVAEQPERLLDVLHDQKNVLEKKIHQLQERMPEFKSIFNAIADKPKVKYYEGVEGLKSVQRDFVETLRGGGVIYTIVPYDDVNRLPFPCDDFWQLRLDRNIKTRILYTAVNGRNTEYEAMLNKYDIDFAYITCDNCFFKGGMNVYGNKIFLIDYQGKLGGIVIENQTLADLFKTIFMMIWNHKAKAI